MLADIDNPFGWGFLGVENDVIDLVSAWCQDNRFAFKGISRNNASSWLQPHFHGTWFGKLLAKHMKSDQDLRGYHKSIKARVQSKTISWPWDDLFFNGCSTHGILLQEDFDFRIDDRNTQIGHSVLAHGDGQNPL